MSKSILHMITPLKHMSPFDVNMAADAGFDVVATYGAVTLDEVKGLTQDAIFSRNPAEAARTGLFIAGKNAALALDMMRAAQESFVGPFQLSLFADPAGGFTTAAAMAALSERLLIEKTGAGLKGRRVVAFGATGVVGFSAGVIAALEGAEVILAGYDGPARVTRAAEEMKSRFGVAAVGADATSPEKKAALLAGAEVAFAAAAAGVEVISAELLAGAKGLRLAADVNAVPPAGVAGMGLFDKGAALGPHGAMGLGPLAIGEVKYKTQAGLFRQMLAAGAPVAYDFRDAFALARQIVAGAA